MSIQIADASGRVVGQAPRMDVPTFLKLVYSHMEHRKIPEFMRDMGFPENLCDTASEFVAAELQGLKGMAEGFEKAILEAQAKKKDEG